MGDTSFVKLDERGLIGLGSGRGVVNCLLVPDNFGVRGVSFFFREIGLGASPNGVITARCEARAACVTLGGVSGCSRWVPCDTEIGSPVCDTVKRGLGKSGIAECFPKPDNGHFCFMFSNSRRLNSATTGNLAF